MSEINPHDAIQTLPQDRETLYHLVWREPAERIAAQYGISTELLARRCSEMRIPRPLAACRLLESAGEGNCASHSRTACFEKGEGGKDT